MKKIFCLCVSAALFAAAVVSCEEPEEPVLVSSVRLSQTEITLEIYDFTTLVATVLPDNADNKNISWSSSDTNVVVVKDGKLTAMDTGTVAITVTTVEGGKTATCSVTVTPLHVGETRMVFVEGGTFTMGASAEEIQKEEAYSWEGPAHEVTLSSFKIAVTSVTQKQWKAIMSTNTSLKKGDDLPVENIKLADILEFIRRLNEATGKKYRLPTEAEWEFAARGGKESQGYKYSGSNDINAVAWYSGNANSTTHAVGTKLPNELGIYDMSGNIREFCKDFYSAYTSAPQTNPQGPNAGFDYIIRGGSYGDGAMTCRVSFRDKFEPSAQNPASGFISFRLAISYP